MTSALTYQVYVNVPGRSLVFVDESLCLGDDARELLTIETAHHLMPGDVVCVNGTWWGRSLDRWTPLELPEDHRFEYRGKPWNQALAAQLHEQAARHRAGAATIHQNLVRKTRKARRPLHGHPAV